MASKRSKLLEGLNPEQKKAVTHGEGPLLIVAGPGTGKTRVLTHRIAYLVEQKIARPEEILALTFTDKAAREMEERVDLLVPYGYTETAISTFHAFGDRVLRERGLELGVSYRGVLTPAEQIIFVTDRLFDFDLHHFRPLGSPTKHVQALLQLVSRCKDEAITPEDYQQAAEKLVKSAKTEEEKLAAAKHRELASFYKRYQELLAHEGRVDYGDQVLLALHLFRHHPDILAEYRERYPWILVDELQDTNYAQFELLKLLAGEQSSLTVVGDDDQSIYRFRGAAVSNILGFRQSYPSAETVVLTRNYRSTAPILEASYRLIRENDPDRLESKLKISKRLSPVSKQREPIAARPFATISEEADWIAAEAAKLLGKGVSGGEIAILVRSNTAATPFLQALAAKGIPYQWSGREALYERPEVRFLLAGLRAIADPEQDLSIYHLATSPAYGAPVAEALRLLHEAARGHRPLYELIGEISTLGELSKAGERAFLKLREDLERGIERSRELPVGTVLYQFLQESGCLRLLLKEESLEAEQKIQNIARFFDRVREFQEVAEDTSAVHYLRHLEELIAAGEDPSASAPDRDAGAVQVLTVHAAKGLEFGKVYLASLVQDIFPARRGSEGLLPPEALLSVPASRETHLAEERRLCYVGMTRAKRSLTVSWSRDLGGKRLRKPSQFLAEALRTEETPQPMPLSPLERIERMKPAPRLPVIRKLSADEPLVLSYRQIDDYLICPRRYYYLHVLRLPIAPSHSLVYGRAVHAGIVEFYRARMRGRILPVSTMLEAYRTAWSNEGFLSRAHEEARHVAGETLLRRFHQQHRGDSPPVAIEKEFHFPVGIDRVVGRWDYVAEHDGSVEILDFKTGDIPDQKAAEKRSKGDLQLGIYALAYREVFGKIPDRLTLYFVEPNLRGTSLRSEQELAGVAEQIKQVAAGIRAADFDPNPDHKKDCLCLQLGEVEASKAD